MVLAVVRSHYNPGSKVEQRERIYRAGNALAEWLGLDSWVDIVAMQSDDHREAFAKVVGAAL